MNIARLKAKLDEVYVVEPNDLHVALLTRLYKLTTGNLKRMPFIFIIPFSFAVSVFIYVLFGLSLVRLVSILQYGF